MDDWKLLQSVKNNSLNNSNSKSNNKNTAKFSKSVNMTVSNNNDDNEKENSTMTELCHFEGCENDETCECLEIHKSMGNYCTEILNNDE
jgi:hypothetical protein